MNSYDTLFRPRFAGRPGRVKPHAAAVACSAQRDAEEIGERGARGQEFDPKERPEAGSKRPSARRDQWRGGRLRACGRSGSAAKKRRRPRTEESVRATVANGCRRGRSRRPKKQAEGKASRAPCEDFSTPPSDVRALRAMIFVWAGVTATVVVVRVPHVIRPAPPWLSQCVRR